MGLTGALHLSAAAKVNLGLEVTGVRDDGFHELRSIIVNVDITDTITLAPGAGTVVAGEEALATPAAPGEELASRALRRLEVEAGRDLGVGIRLRKRIPAGRNATLMRGLSFERVWLQTTLTGHGFEQIEFAILPTHSNQDPHPCVFARKPRAA